MRGNERSLTPSIRWPRTTFQIPMRGNEMRFSGSLLSQWLSFKSP